jgi:CRP-like cAMP-binding protein
VPPDDGPPATAVTTRRAAPRLRVVSADLPYEVSRDAIEENPMRSAPRDLLLTDSERRIALRRIVGFDRLAADALGAVAKLTHRRELAPGTALATPGAPRSSIHVVLAGDVLVRRHDRPWSPPHAPPLLDLFWLARDRAPVSIQTRGGAVTLEIPMVELEEIFEEHFSIWLATTRALAGWLDDLLPPARNPRLEVARPSLPGLHGYAERLTALHDALRFANGRIDALGQLVEAATEVHFDAGAVVWHAGDRATTFLVALDGILDGGHDGLAGSELGMVGALETLAERPRAATLRAHTRVRALELDCESFLDVLEDHHDLARDFVALLAASAIAAVPEPIGE